MGACLMGAFATKEAKAIVEARAARAVETMVGFDSKTLLEQCDAIWEATQQAERDEERARREDPYSGTAVVRGEILRQYPQLRGLLDTISKRLTNEVMLDLNARVDVDGQDPADVAYDWLVSQGLVVEDDPDA